jgi:biliverdin reductase
MTFLSINQLSLPVKVGLIGTGYAARKRAEAIQADPRSKLCLVSGFNLEKTAEFCQKFGGDPVLSWQALVSDSELDLIIISTINRDHGIMVRGALENHKHVVVEYPLALNYQVATDLVRLAKLKQKLLHVEHIELLGGLHQTMAQYLSDIGEVSYANYTTINPQDPVPKNWKYHYEMFGFPFCAALSRLHRLTDLFGEVISVSCNTRFWNSDHPEYYRSCLAIAQLKFQSGLLANLVYGKGETFAVSDRSFALHGSQANLLFQGQKGSLIKGNEIISLDVANRRGLFAKDSQMVLDYLLEEKPLYVSVEASLYALKIANLAQISSERGETVFV